MRHPGRTVATVLAVAGAGLGGVVAARNGVAPTATSPALDALLTGGYAAVVALAGAAAPAWVLAAAAGVALVLTGGTAAGVAALGALATAVAQGTVRALARRPPRPAGALSGALLAVAVLDLPMGDPFGVSALVAAALTVPVLATGWYRAPRRIRRPAAWAAAGVAVAALAAVVAFGVVVARTRGTLEVAAQAAEAGLAAARDGDAALAVEQLTRAEAGFATAAASLHGPLASAARAVPVVAQHAAALSTLADQGQALAAAGVVAAGRAAPEQLTATAGRVDVERVAETADALAGVHRQMAATIARFDAQRSPWLAPIVTERLDQLTGRLADALPDAETAALAARVAPRLLGADGPRRYFVAFTTPAEARGLGGFMGNFGELTVADGQVNLTRFGRVADLVDATPGTPRVTGPADFVARYGWLPPELVWSNVTLPPDLPTVAAVIGELYPQAGGPPVDGVLVVDPEGLAALLALTGPVPVDGLDGPLDAANAARYLLIDQYARFDPATGGNPERIDVLGDAARATFEHLTRGSLPGPATLAEVLGPAAQAGHLQAFDRDPEIAALWSRLGVDNRFPTGAGDVAAVVTQNAGNTKIDTYLRRSLDLDVTLAPGDTGAPEPPDPAGTGRLQASAPVAVTARARITLANDAPTEGLPPVVLRTTAGDPPGSNRMWLSYYSRLDVVGARLDGQPVEVTVERELDSTVASLFLTVGPGAERILEVDLAGSLPAPDGYRLAVRHQPTVQPDEVGVTVRRSDGLPLGVLDGFVRDPGDPAVATYAGAPTQTVRLLAGLPPGP